MEVEKQKIVIQWIRVSVMSDKKKSYRDLLYNNVHIVNSTVLYT